MYWADWRRTEAYRFGRRNPVRITEILHENQCGARKGFRHKNPHRQPATRAKAWASMSRQRRNFTGPSLPSIGQNCEFAKKLELRGGAAVTGSGGLIIIGRARCCRRMAAHFSREVAEFPRLVGTPELRHRPADIAECRAHTSSHLADTGDANESNQSDQQSVLNQVLGFLAACQALEFHVLAQKDVLHLWSLPVISQLDPASCMR